MTSPDSYTRTEILTASPQQLRALVLKHALHEARRLLQAVEQEAGEKILSSGSRLRALVLELIPAKSTKMDSELLERLRSIGVYLYRRIGIACSQRDPEVASEIIQLLAFEQETWKQAMSRLETDSPIDVPPGRTNLAG
ncbi:MAG: flagellar protein FliS [Planctomycetota bacterium]|nr:flagellar protein FliS [Planctomycetota bacterium]